jgi:hypothetical protein
MSCGFFIFMACFTVILLCVVKENISADCSLLTLLFHISCHDITEEPFCKYTIIKHITIIKNSMIHSRPLDLF